MLTLMIRFILPFSLLAFLLFFSQSLPTSSAAAADGGEGVVLVPFKRVLLSQQLPAKTGGDQRVISDQDGDGDVDEHLPHKLGIHMRKARSGGGVATRARGKTSSSAAVLPTQPSSSLLACCFFLALVLL